MGGSVEERKEQQGVGELAMEPQVLVEGEETKLWADNADERTADREENKHAIDGQNKTGTTGNPHGEFERVKTG